jgi:cytochrome c oxidase cbb3-type subunit 3
MKSRSLGLAGGAAVLVCWAFVSTAQPPPVTPAPTTPPPTNQPNAAATPAANPPATPVRRRRNDTYPDYDAVSVERGQKEFVSTCGFCHGSNAKGGETGPDLLRSVVVLDDVNGNKIGEVVHNGRPAKGMPKFALTDAQILDIANFLHNSIKMASERGSYQILNIVVGNAQAGQTYFEAKCASCHSVTGDLKGIGAKLDPVALQDRLLMPREGRSFGPSGPVSEKSAVTVTVTPPSGDKEEGVLTHIDDFLVALTTPKGEYRSFARDGDVPKVEVHDPLEPHLKMLTHYTDDEIHNLTAYLVTLK